jgi:hypothetical protein
VKIDTTEEILWDVIYNQLVNTEKLKNILQKTIKENPSFSSKVRKQKGKIKDELNLKEKELKSISEGIIDIERRRILNEFQSEQIYQSLKKELDKEYRKCHITIENLKNSMSYYGEQDRWYSTLENISSTLKSITNFTTQIKRSILDDVLDKVILSHNSTTLLHTLQINLKIPLLDRTHGRPLSSAPSKNLLKPLKNKGVQLQTRSFHSTVINCSPKTPNMGTNLLYSPDLTKGYYLTMVIQVSSPNLWTSPYSEHQQTLFGIIKTKHEEEGMNFVQISDWLNENQFKTPRGKVFTQSHVWSMYTKKMRSIQRFSRNFNQDVLDTGLDVINYVVDPRPEDQSDGTT